MHLSGCVVRHGGGGGGATVLNETAPRGSGMPGYTPMDTPRDATGSPSLNHRVYNDVRDTTDLPPYHLNLDLGYAPLVRGVPIVLILALCVLVITLICSHLFEVCKRVCW